MSLMTSIFPKDLSSSTYSMRQKFKLNKQQQTKTLVVPSVKLQHLFAKKPAPSFKQQKFSSIQTSLNNKKQIAYINLGIEENQYKNQHNSKGTFLNPIKDKELCHQRYDQSLPDLTTIEIPIKIKRNRHQSLDNLVENYSLFAPNRQKENLQKFQKKLIKSLKKKENPSQINPIDIIHGLRFISSSNTQSHPESLHNSSIQKLKDKQSRTSSHKTSDKWKILALKLHNKSKISPRSYLVNALNTTQPKDKFNKKLVRRYQRQNLTLHNLNPYFRTGQNQLQQKQRVFEKSQQKQNEMKSFKKKQKQDTVLKQKFKLVKLDKNLGPRDEQKQRTDGERSNRRDSKNKLEKWLGCRKKCSMREKNLLLTPWEWVPSEQEININF